MHNHQHDSSQRIGEFKLNGFTVFQKMYDEEQMQRWRDVLARLQQEFGGNGDAPF
jgi:hypothetical protein